MHALRSIVCAGLALIAVSLCSAMPAAASGPIDVSVAVSTTAKELHPAPAVHVAVQDVAVLPTAVTLNAPDKLGRSSAGNDSPIFADTSIVPPAYQHIDPDITA